MAGHSSKRCIDCKTDISQRGRAARRCNNCAKAERQRQAIEQQEKRAELKAVSGGTVTRAHTNSLLKKQARKCAHCGKKFQGHGKDQMTIDHHIPLLRGGQHDDSNIKRFLCRSCNSSKNSKTPRQWEALRLRTSSTLPAPRLFVEEERAKTHKTVRFRHPDDVSLIKKVAAADGIPVNQWIVNILLDAAQRSSETGRSAGLPAREGTPPPLGYEDDDHEVYPAIEEQRGWETGWTE